MSTETSSVESIDDLDTFSAEFFGQGEAEPDVASQGVQDNDDVDAPDKDTQGEVDDAPTEEDPSEEGDDKDPEEGSEEDPKPKKSRFQERIDELIGKAREAERREAALRAEFEELKKQLEKTEEPKTPDASSGKGEGDSSGPSVDDKNEDGTDKYPLGEFDPAYIRDLTRYTLEQERKAIKAAEEAERRQQEEDARRAELQSSWQSKLDTAQERYPDFQEKGQALIESLSGLNEAYGEYLSETIMGMEYGADVFYYLSSNPDVAKEIVNSGATKATIALGRLEAKFAEAEEEKKKAKPKVSKAPSPPPLVNRGSAGGVIDVADDTDDLDAFAKKFFKRR